MVALRAWRAASSSRIVAACALSSSNETGRPGGIAQSSSATESSSPSSAGGGRPSSARSSDAASSSRALARVRHGREPARVVAVDAERGAQHAHVDRVGAARELRERRVRARAAHARLGLRGRLARDLRLEARREPRGLRLLRRRLQVGSQLPLAVSETHLRRRRRAR